MIFVSKGLPWSGGIGKKVEGIISSSEVMKQAGIDFTVKKCEVFAKMPFTINGNNTISAIDAANDAFSKDGAIYRNLPGAYATYRTDLNIPLGYVKERYEVIQNRDAFNFFDDAIGVDKAIWTTAGCFGQGHKIFVTAKLPITTEVGKDPVDHYLVFSNSHDGSSSVNIMFTPIRVFCTNVLNAALKESDSFIRIKHTESAKQKLDESSRLLKIACENAKNSTDLYNCLYATKMDDAEVKHYIAKLILTDKEYMALMDYDKYSGITKLVQIDYYCLEKTGISTRKANTIKSMYQYYLFGVAQDDIRGTAWGAYNAVTGYYSHATNDVGEKRMNTLLYGNANKIMNNALVEAYNIKAA